MYLSGHITVYVYVYMYTLMSNRILRCLTEVQEVSHGKNTPKIFNLQDENKNKGTSSYFIYIYRKG